MSERLDAQRDAAAAETPSYLRETLAAMRAAEREYFSVPALTEEQRAALTSDELGARIQTWERLRDRYQQAAETLANVAAAAIEAGDLVERAKVPS